MVYKGKDFLDYYQLLGLNPESSQAEIEHHFRDYLSTASVYESEVTIHAIETLLDPISRQEYDYVWRSYYDQTFQVTKRWWEESALYGFILLLMLIASVVLMVISIRNPGNEAHYKFILASFSATLSHYTIFPIARFMLLYLRNKSSAINIINVVFSLGTVTFISTMFSQYDVPLGWTWEAVTLIVFVAPLAVVLRFMIQIWLIEPRTLPGIRRGVDLGLLAATIFFVLLVVPDSAVRYWLLGCAINSYFVRL